MSAGGPKGSVRLRLTLWYAGAMALGLVLYAAIALGFLWNSLRRDLDRQLEQDIAIAAAILEDEDGKLGWDKDQDVEHLKVEKPWVEIKDEKDKVLFRSPELARGIAADPNVRWLAREARIDGAEVKIRAARPLRPAIREMQKLGLGLVLALPLTVGMAGMIGWFLARRALAPIGRMAENARAITAERLDARLEIADPRDEFGQLATVFNATLERLERSFDRLRRFTADASHELRTPLTALRSVGEVGLREERTPAEYREIVGSMLEESDRLTRLVDTLLTLSRADGGQAKLERAPTELGRLAAGIVQQMEPLAEEKNQQLSVDADAGCSAPVDPPILRQALANLIDNAIKYSPRGSRIDVRIAQAEEGRVAISVLDEGPGIPPEEAERIFERFYRIDKHRSRESGGTGLGLSIARWAVEAHGGRIEALNRPGGGSEFRIALPGR